MKKLATGFAAALLTAGMSCAAIAGPGNSGDNGRGNGGGNAGGQSAGAGGNGVGGGSMGHPDWTGGWNEYFSSTQVGNGVGLGRRNYGLAVRVQAWRGTWGAQLGGEGGRAHADGDMHVSARLQNYLGTKLGVGSRAQ